MLEPAMFIGLGLVAFWVYLRFPRLRPRLARAGAILHVAVSFGAFATIAGRTGLLAAARAVPRAGPILALGLLIPTLTYVLAHLGLATCADPARPVRRYTSRRPSCLERILSAPPVGALGGH